MSCLAPLRPADDDEEEGVAGGAAGEGGAPRAVEELEVEDSVVEEMHPAEEARAARPARDPGAPTAAMVAAHAATHLPYRSWCQDCVKGRRDNVAHKHTGADALEVPEVCFDYAFVRREGEEEVITLLVMRDRGSRALRTWVVPEKGASSEDTVLKAVDGVLHLGYRGRVLVKCDGEPAIKALRTAIMEKLPEGAIPIATAAGESASNGVAENAVKITKGLMRVHLGALERKVGVRFPSDHPVLAWLAEFVGDSCTKYLQGSDGRTAYERLFGKPCREEALEFGEVVLFRPKTRADANVLLEARWAQGVWLGRRWGSTISRIHSQGEVVDARAVQRVPAAERWSAAALSEVRATPWCVRPGAPDEDAPIVVLPPLPGGAAAAAPPPEPLGYRPRGVFITRADLETWGYTAGCRRCTMVREGARAQGVAHRKECRVRLEGLLREAGDPRCAAAEARVLAAWAAESDAAELAAEAAAAAAAAGPAAGPAAAAAAPATPIVARGAAAEDDWGDLAARLRARQAARAASASAAAPAPQASSAASAELEAAWGAVWGAAAAAEGENEDFVQLADAKMLDDGMLVGRVRASEEMEEGDLTDALPADTPDAVRAEATSLLEMLLVYGVGAEAAKAKVAELYSPPRVTKELRKVRSMNLAAGTTFDMVADAAGRKWDFRRAEDRARARRLIAEEQPYLVIGSPPCTEFSRLNINLNKGRVAPRERQRRLAEGRLLLNFAAEIYRDQLARGAHFLHEHPLAATSWEEPAIAALRALPQVQEATADQCCFGLMARDPSGKMELVMKPTRFLSSAPLLLKELARRCSKAHHHTRLLGGRRAAAAAIYPPGLCRAILRGIARQFRRDGLVVPAGVGRAFARGPGVYDLSSLQDAGCTIAAIRSASTRGPSAGERVRVDESPPRVEDETPAAADWHEYWDELTGEHLPTGLVQASRAEELEFLREWEVWEEVPVEECHRVTGRKPLGGRWVDVNKGDARTPVVRCRYVAKDFANGKSDEFFAATPPLEALRLLLAHVAGRNRAEKISVVDARKAHLHAHVDRPIFVELPPEVARPGFCARLKRCLYGTRDAPKRWEAYAATVMAKLGFVRGRASPCCFSHPARGLRCVLHGDDFVLAGSPKELTWVKAAMSESFLTKEVGTLGDGAGDVTELRILNRVVRWGSEGLTYEADPRHADILREGIAGAARSLSSPGTLSKDLNPEDDEALPEAAAGLYRSFAARANYLALDRPDLAFAAKELCRRMRNPGKADLEALRRLGRYLLDSPRVVYDFRWGSTSDQLIVYADTDFAGCRATRRSTSGGCALWGGMLVKHWSTTQKAITLSSGEAELGGVVKAASEALGLQSVAEDLGIRLRIALCTDSSAAVGICRRAGIGRVRHLAVGQLWIQELVRDEVVDLFKVRGELNPADMLTKPLGRVMLDGHMERLLLHRMEGRAASAPAASAEVNTSLAAGAPSCLRESLEEDRPRWADVCEEWSE